jgi:hypothetical protein
MEDHSVGVPRERRSVVEHNVGLGVEPKRQPREARRADRLGRRDFRKHRLCPLGVVSVWRSRKRGFEELYSWEYVYRPDGGRLEDGNEMERSAG